MTLTELREDIKRFREEHLFDYEKRSDPFSKKLFQPDDEAFEKVRGKDSGKIFLVPAQTIYGLQFFRGQAKDYDDCLPTIYRKRERDDGSRSYPSRLEIFIDRMRLVEFEFMLKSHTFVKDWFEPNNLNVDFEGLAQHYGLNTEVLDFTSDIDVALFFAICSYNKADDSYRLPDENEPHSGIVYVLNPIYYNSRGLLNNHLNIFEDELSPIGLQPFERPAVQKGYSLKLKNGRGLNRVRKYEFSYTMDEARDIFEKYNRKEKLWVEDELIEPTKRIAKKKNFNYSVFAATWKRHPIEGLTKSECKKMLRERGFVIDCHQKIESFSMEVWNRRNKILRNRYEKYLPRLVSRKILSCKNDPKEKDKLIAGEEISDCMLTDTLAELLMLRTVKTGRSAPALTIPALPHPDLDIASLPIC